MNVRLGAPRGWSGPALLAAAGIVLLWIVVPILLGKGWFRHLPLTFGLGCAALGVAGLATAILDARLRVRRGVSWLGALLLVAGSIAPLAAGAAIERVAYLDRLGLVLGAVVAYFGSRAVFASGRNRRLRAALPWLAAATLGLHLAAGGWRFFVRDETRMAGFVLQPNLFATVVAALALPLVLPALRSPRRDPRVLAAVVALAVALPCSGSRAAIGLVLAAVFVYVLAVPGGRKTALVVGGAGIALLLVLTLVPNPLRSRLESKVDRTFPRTFIWERAARMAVEHPLGVGLGMHRWYFARDAWIESEPSLSNRRHEIGIAHNVVLGSAAEAGIAGGAGVVLLLAAFAAAAFRARERWRRASARAWFCGALVLVLHAQVDGVAQSAPAFGVLAVVAAVAESRLVPRSPRDRTRSRPVRALAPALLLIAAFVPTVTSLVVGQRLRDAAFALAANDLRAARAGFESVRDRIGINSAAALGLAEVARRESDAASPAWSTLGIEVNYAEAARANPFDAKPHVQLADLRRARHFAERRTDRHLLLAALDGYDRALAADPLALPVRMMRARLRRELGDFDAAAADLDEVLRLEPHHPLALQAYGDLEMARGNRDAAVTRWFAAVQAYLAAQRALGDARYGALPYLIEIVTGFDPKACEARIIAATNQH